ncbi:HD domain-containing protein [Candidatus Dojkabacteria bacterium]|nr:HD domain-containing protein [Candidatus Dojkabacteria bacterium]
MNYKNIAEFLFEVGQARNVQNVGWQLINAENIPSIAEHSYRNAIIALLLAEMEGVENIEKVALNGLLHKLHKVRLGDRHKVSANYLDYPPEVKSSIRGDQLSLLGDDLKKRIENILELNDELKEIVKDADQLELALEAKEYIDKGYKKAQVWLDRIDQVLQTNSAKKLFDEIIQTHSCNWWLNLKKKPQTKRNDYISRV